MCAAIWLIQSLTLFAAFSVPIRITLHRLFPLQMDTFSLCSLFCSLFSKCPLFLWKMISGHLRSTWLSLVLAIQCSGPSLSPGARSPFRAPKTCTRCKRNAALCTGHVHSVTQQPTDRHRHNCVWPAAHGRCCHGSPVQEASGFHKSQAENTS